MQVRPTQAIIDLGAITHNLALVRQRAPGNALCAVVKANAYGHGLVPVGRAVANAGAEFLGVALVEEGVQLRQADITAPILVWGATLAGGYGSIIAHGLTPVLSTPEHVQGLASAAGSGNGPLGVHVEVDTGMARLGTTPEDLPALLDALAACPGLRLEGLMSHMASADHPGHAFNAVQLQRWQEAVEAVQRRGLTPRWWHLGNSPATLSQPLTHTGLVRCGLLLYGLEPMATAVTEGLRPALSWTTKVVAQRTLPAGSPVSYGCRFVTQRPSRIATLAVGYADGYPRLLSNRAHVLIRGQAAPVVGIVCMDLCMADITDIPDATVGDDVILIGTAPGGARISADDVARWSNTISYETLCAIGARVARHYIPGLP